MWALRREEKWRPDRISAPEAGEIRRGRWEGPSGRNRRGTEGNHLAHSDPGACWAPRWVPCPPKPPPGLVGPLGHRREVREIRRGRQEGSSGRRGRGAEGNCPTHLGPGSLLSSQADPLSSKTPPGHVGPWGHRREAGENRRGRQKEPSGMSQRRAGEEQRAFALPTLAQEACWAPRWGPAPSEMAFSSPVGPKHRPLPPPKPCPCLGPALNSQGLFPHFFFFFSFFFSFPLLWYWCTFQLLIHLYLYFYILSNISVSFLVYFYFLLCYCSLLFIYLFCHPTQLAGSWFMSQGSGQSSCGGSSESKPLDQQKTSDPREYSSEWHLTEILISAPRPRSTQHIKSSCKSISKQPNKNVGKNYQ